MLTKALILYSILCLVLGCASKSQRFDKRIDGPPQKALLAAEILDAVPRADPIMEQGNFSPYVVNGVTYEVIDEYKDYTMEGLASWYGMKFHGRKTANGETFDVSLPTAAHRSLPIPCYVRVTNLENRLSMIVRVNDRGPFHPDRIIDLSYGAAVRLDFVEEGVAKVSVSVIDVIGVEDRRPNVAGEYRHLQLGAFRSKRAADQLVRKVEAVSEAPVFLSPVQLGEVILYRVRVGPLPSTRHVFAEKEALESSGFSPLQPLP